MQQRGLNINMEGDSEEKNSIPLPRGRTNAKLKVLVRSHAMREEASPPREPPHLSVMSPCIKLIPSPNSSPSHSPSISKPVVVLSPSISRGNSPCHSPQYVSPASTLISSPISRSSSHEHMDTVKVQITNHERETGDSGYSEGCRSNSPKYSISRSFEETSQCSNRRKGFCDCTNQTCTNCLKNCERNFNNNLSSNINNNIVSSTNTLTVNRGFKSKLRQQSSSHGSFEGSSSNSPCLSRDNSAEQYTDTTGIDLEQFIAETLNRNGKDRSLMLRIEYELVSLAKDKIKTHFKFPSMSSYQRMLVHRCAAYFGMDHNIESSGKCVVVNKTKSTRIPDIAFKEYIKEDIIFSEEPPRRSILKRDSNSIEDFSFKSPDRQYDLENRRSKSFEEREEEYEKVRKRIFNREIYNFGSADEFGWPGLPWSATDSDCAAQLRLLQSDRYPRRLLKVQSVEASSDLPRPHCVAKSYSFGGYGGVSVLARGDSVLSTHSAGPRLLTKQDSGASTVSWRLSPSSSGYKSQSQISESITPSPTSTPNPPYDSTRQDSTNSNTSNSTNEAIDKDQIDSHLVWAVTDIHDVPKGSVIIDPQTGQSIKNSDGSVYHYDPLNLPPGFCDVEHAPTEEAPLPHKLSPEKQRSKSSPILSSSKKNSSTSPSLPFSPPPLQQSRSMQFSTSSENVPNLSTQQYHPVYGNSFNNLSAHDTSMPVYHQPYVVYAYGVPVQSQFEGRMEPSVQEIPGNYFVADTSVNSGQQSVPCQSSAPYWNQQPLTVYQTATTNPTLSQPLPQRYIVPVSTQPGSYVPSSFPTTYIPPSAPNIQSIPQSTQTTDLIPIYPHQPVQVVYPTSANPPNPVVYPNHGVVYAQNPSVYSNVIVPLHNVQYPQNPPTPNSPATSIGQLQEQLGQISLSQNPPNSNIVFSQFPPLGQSFDTRIPKSHIIKGNKFSIPRNVVPGSSQSSTGTSSPATTVIVSSCSNQNSVPCGTPSETPPTTFAAYGSNFLPSMIHRQISNVHASPPISSRSPTPASDISHIEHRYSMPPTMLQGVSYVLQGDPRMIPGRGLPINARQIPFRHHSFNNPGIDNSNKPYKSKRSRTNKAPSVPVTGK